MKRKNNKIWLNTKVKYLSLTIPMFLGLSLFVPGATIADTSILTNNNTATPTQTETATPKKVVYVTVTAYSSTPDQTDSTPCFTANNYNLCKNNKENVVATNFLPFGTKVKIPGYFGDQEFSVQDRMNKRFNNRLDVWMKSREAAMEFGIRTLRVEIYDTI